MVSGYVEYGFSGVSRYAGGGTRSVYGASRAMVWNFDVAGVPDSLLLVAGEDEIALQSESSSLKKRAWVGVADSSVGGP